MSSMQYTIGTALERAREAGSTVEVLVDQHWLCGLVVANDGIGVVLDHDGEEHCVVRLERIAAVRVGAQAPLPRRIPGTREGDATPEAARYDGARYDGARYDGARHDGSRLDGAMPMPGPQVASA